MTDRGARFLINVLALTVAAWLSPAARGQGVEGAWALERYDMQGERQDDVSGTLVLAGGEFGMIYTMRSEGGAWSGRGHGGSYSERGDRLIFDVEWWPESVNGAARIAGPEQVTAEVEVDGDMLTLHFGSGSLQQWRRHTRATVSPEGLWRLEELETDRGRRDAAGVLLLGGGRFVFVFSGEGERCLESCFAIGGALEENGWTVETTVAVQDGRGKVSRQEQRIVPVFPPGKALILQGAEGEEYVLRR